MTESDYPAPHRLTVDDLDPESTTIDALIARVRRHREGEEYSTPEQRLGNLPTVLRALCDHVLTSQATAMDIAYQFASIIDARWGPRHAAPGPRGFSPAPGDALASPFTDLYDPLGRSAGGAGMIKQPFRTSQSVGNRVDFKSTNLRAPSPAHGRIHGCYV